MILNSCQNLEFYKQKLPEIFDIEKNIDPLLNGQSYKSYFIPWILSI